MQKMQKTQVRSLGQKDPLEEEMARNSSILVWEISWTEESGVIVSCSCRNKWASKFTYTVWKLEVWNSFHLEIQGEFIPCFFLMWGFVVEPEKLCISNNLPGDVLGPWTTLWAAGFQHLGFCFFHKREWITIISLLMNIQFTNIKFMPYCFVCLPFWRHCKFSFQYWITV